MKGGEGKKAGKDLRNSVKKSDVTEIKSLSAPPENVKQVMRETLVLLGYKRRELQDYGFIKKVIGSSKFLSQLKELKAEDVPVGVAAEVKSEMSSLSYEQLSKAISDSDSRAVSQYSCSQQCGPRASKQIQSEELKQYLKSLEEYLAYNDPVR
ncbi:hypothetical protein EB796_003449 [Bugula neritina]|uniref:Uncharacterized protein n=1 Tax=Bugula neritina TaxID=10212 RepID=A0A7J7KK52_BUGNE|nr:hypothetical protein EB796_003449 [Bugula neritina]